MKKLADIRARAHHLGITDPSLDQTELIRRIQSYEGYSPCFKTKSVCVEMKCLWREECLKKC